MLMTKKQAIAIITKCAKQYQQYLEGNQVVFVYRAALNNRLSEDIRSIVPKAPEKIFAIFKKPIGAPLYTQLTYNSKNINITKKCLPKELLTEVDTSLLEDNNNSDDNEPA